MFDNIKIPSLDNFLAEDCIYWVESQNNEDRKALTEIKKTLQEQDVLLEYSYHAKTKKEPAKAFIKILPAGKTAFKTLVKQKMNDPVVSTKL